MKRYLSDAALAASSQALGAFVTLGVQVASVRLLSPAEYGAYATAAAIVALVEGVFIARGGEVALASLGRHWSKDTTRARWYWRHLIRNDWKLNWIIFAMFV